jgi:DNA modification methylase
MGDIWYRWKDDERLAKHRLTDLAPKLKRDRTYLQKCLLLSDWNRTGLIARIETETADYHPRDQAEPYHTCARHAEYMRRIRPKPNPPLLTKNSDIGSTARESRDTLEYAPIPPVPRTRFLLGDALEELCKLPDNSEDVLLCSPAYHHKRDYMIGQPAHLREKQLGLEPTVKEHVGALVEIFREARRVLKPSGSLVVVVDDRHSSGLQVGTRAETLFARRPSTPRRQLATADVPRKALCLIPERLLIALVDDGWHPRMKIIWDKRGGTAPETAIDRLDHAYETILVLTKSKNYYWNDSIKTPVMSEPSPRAYQIEHGTDVSGQTMKKGQDVLTIMPVARSGSIHPARFPEALARRVLRWLCPPGGHVLDCFGGSGTTAVAANKLGMDCTLIELHPDFMAEAKRNVAAVAAPTPKLKPLVCKHGTIIHGTCLDELRKLSTGSVGTVLFDPPYANGATALAWDRMLDWDALWEELLRVIKIDGSIIVNCNARLLAKLIEKQPTLYRTTWHWWRANHSNAIQSPSQPMRHIEYVVVFNRVAQASFRPVTTPLTGPYYLVPDGRIDDRDCWVSQQMPIDLLYPEWEVGEKISVATHKPISLGVYMLNTYAGPGDVVLDITCGSGCYLISTMRTGHQFIGIEKDEKHFRIAVDRVGAESDRLGQEQAAE